MGIGVDFDHRAGLGGGDDDLIQIDRVGIPGQEEPAGRMAEHRHPGVGCGPDEPLVICSRGSWKLEWMLATT